MKKLASVALALALLLGGCSGGSGARDFRNASWGMTPQQVADTEDESYVFADDSTIFYVTQLPGTGEDIEVTYSFTDGALTSAELRFTQQERTIQELIDSYLAFREQLIGTYGQPVDPEYRVWLEQDPGTKDDPDKNQIYYGRMQYLTRWETESGWLELSLSCTGQKISYALVGAAA